MSTISVVMSALLVAGAMTQGTPSSTPGGAIDADELARYRLTTEVFERFVVASGRIAAIARGDDSLIEKPLFTRELVLSGDAVTEAAALVERLRAHPHLNVSLRASRIAPREYTVFAITLIAAHLADGFLKSGAMSRVPPGTPTLNVEFVRANATDVAAVLATLGIRD